MTKPGKTQEGNRKAGTADARKNADFGGIGGKADGYSAPKKGTGSGGGNTYHSKATVAENKNPPSARDYEKFSPKAPKSTQEY